MPPFAFTHLKNAAAERGAELKSMPPLAVVRARTLTGVPVAAFPLPMPHLTADAEVSSLPTSASLLFPDDPPHAESATTASASAAASAARRYLVILLLLQKERRSTGSACGRR